MFNVLVKPTCCSRVAEQFQVTIMIVQQEKRVVVALYVLQNSMACCLTTLACLLIALSGRYAGYAAVATHAAQR
jgi:hypothetical protein